MSISKAPLLGPAVRTAPIQYDTLADFTAAGGATAYGVGPVWIAGQQYWCDGVGLTPVSKQNKSYQMLKSISGAMEGGNTNRFVAALSMIVPFTHREIQVLLFSTMATPSVGALANFGYCQSAAVPFTPTSLTDLTYNGSTTFDIPVASSGSGLTAVPSVLALDPVSVTPAARTDGGAGHILHCRILNATGQPSVYVSGVHTDSVNDLDIIKHVGTFFSAGSFSTVSNTTAPNNNGGCFGVKILADSPVTSFMTIGDSTMAGQGYGASSSNVSGVGKFVKDQMSLGKKCLLYNMAWGSRTSDTFYNFATAQIPAYKPTVAIFQAGSPNDSTKFTDSWASKIMRYTQYFIEICGQNNVIPIVATMNPNDADTTGQATYRRNFNAAIISMCNSFGVLVGDRGGFYQDASGENYITGMSTDGLHPNKSGYDAESVNVWQPILSKFIQ